MRNCFFIFAVCAFFSCAEKKQEQAIEQEPEKKDSVVPVKPAFDLSKLNGAWKLQEKKENADELFYDHDLFITDSIWKMCDPSRKPIMNSEFSAYEQSCFFYQYQHVDSLQGIVSLKKIPRYKDEPGADKISNRLWIFEIKHLTDSSLVLQKQDAEEEGVYIRVPAARFKP